MITQHNQRVFFSDDGTLQDISLLVNPFRKNSFDLSGYVPGEDYIIIGSDLPFSQKYFDMATANADPSEVNVEIWDGTKWQEAVDILDETSETSGAALSENGVISWKSNKDESDWSRENESSDIPELVSTDIYCFYWLRISFSGTFSAQTALNHVGYKFSSDEDLFSQYPDLQNQQMLDAFEPMAASGTKTDWDEQHLVAAQQLTNKMRKSSIVWSPAQILDYEIMQEAAIHKTAEIIYSAMGQPYEENRKLAQDKYNRAFDMKKFNIDKNKNSRLDGFERVISTSFLGR